MVPPETGSYWIKDHVNEKKSHNINNNQSNTNTTQRKRKTIEKKKVNLFLVFHVAKVYNNIK